MGAIIGIDLGTTNSCVVVLDDGEPVVIPNAEGARTTPSVVAFADGEEMLVGQQAKRQAAINPQRTVQQIKRLIGLRYDDPEVERFARIAGVGLVKHHNGDVWIRVGEQEWSPQEISALILRKLRSTAEDYLGQPVKEAVITVPAYFNDSQRQATRDAGRIAGLNVRRVMNEPTAAALAYGVDRNRNTTIAVFDLGGGTFDISILRIQDGLFEVISTAGDSHLGGEDIDQIIMDHLLEVFEKDTGINIREDRMALQRIREAAETAKCELSTLSSTNVNLPFVAVNDAGPQHLNYVFQRSRLNDLCRNFIDRLSGPCVQALEDAGLAPDALDEVILIGGMTRMPLVQEKVEALFGKKPGRGINPDEAVAIGAALQGGILGGEVREVVLLDVTPQHLGIRVQGNRMSTVIPRNTNIPVRESKVFTTTEDEQREVVLQVLQGNSAEANGNHRLGTFTLGGLDPRPAGEVRVEVSFAIDSDGIVEVSATDQSTGRSTDIRITHAHGLSRGEMDDARDRVSAIVSTDYGDVTSTFPSGG